MEEPLAQFFIWWDGPDGKLRAVNEQESTYRIAQRAFSAGYAARFEAPLEPSRDVLPPAPPSEADAGRLRVRDIFHLQENARRQPTEPDPFAKVRFTGPQQAAMDRLYPLPVNMHTPTTWDGGDHAPETLTMRVVPADLPVRGPTEEL